MPILAKPPDDELAGSLELPGWLRIAWQVVLGALTPLIVSAAMAITLILGPLAWIAAPILGPGLPSDWLATVKISPSRRDIGSTL